MQFNRFIKNTSALISLLLVFTYPINVFADGASDFNNAKSTLSTVESNLASIQSISSETQIKKESLSTDIQKLQEELILINNNIFSVSQELYDAETILSEKEKNIKKTEITIQNLLIEMSNNNKSNNLISISDKTKNTNGNTKEYQELINKNIILSNELKEEKAALENLKIEIQEKLDVLNTQKKIQEEKGNELVELLMQTDTELTKLEAEEKVNQIKYQNAKVAIEEATKQLEEDFKNNGNLSEFVGGEFSWPVPSSENISSYYGYRNIFGYREFHTGIDIAAGYGQNIVAANDGVVTQVIYSNNSYGRYLIIDHGGGYKTLYAHCSSIDVEVGQFIKKGDIIAHIGSTGLSTGNHLHFEIRENNVSVDPLNYV